MTKTWLTIWAVTAAALGIFIAVRNFLLYKPKPWWWKIGKTVIDLGITLGTAWLLPPLLVGWIVYWFIRPMKSGSGKVTIGLLAGMFFGALAFKSMEVIAFLGAMAVDLITGRNGFMMNKQRAEYYERLRQQRQQKEAA